MAYADVHVVVLSYIKIINFPQCFFFPSIWINILFFKFIVYMQAVSMFLVVYAISFPLDEQLSHNLSILGTVL